MTRTLLLASAAALVATPALAQNTPEEEAEIIVVTGTLQPRPANELGSAISILDAEQLIERQTILVSDALRSVPGLAVNRTGPQGTLTQVRIRGAEGNQTLVIIDGIEAANPVFGEFNFANLAAADIARLEVVRGPQSALYGSEAIGGVISVITRSGEEGFQADAEAEVGSFNTYRLYAGVGGGTDRVRGRGSINWYGTDGVSASPTDPEEDGFQNITLNFKGEADLSPNFGLTGVARYVESRVQTDAQDFTFGSPTQGFVIDADQRSESTDFTIGGRADFNGWDDLITGRVYVNWTDADNDGFTNNVLTSIASGSRLDYGAVITGAVSNAHSDATLTLAAEHEDVDFENVNQSVSDEQTSFVAEATYAFEDRLFLAAAVRRDLNDTFRDATTWRASGAYVFPQWGTRIHASYGTGITDPGFFERFGFNPGTFIGNPNLQPEESESFDIGVEQAFLNGRAVIDVTWFTADLTNEITTVFTPPTFIASPINQTGSSSREGVEVSLDWQLTDALALDAQYTYLNAEEPNGLEEVRRPMHTASFTLNYDFLDDRANVNVGLDYNGEQEDSEFIFATPETRVTLDSYTLVRIAGAYELNDRFEIFARGENILDEDYTEVFGFNSTGAAAYAGLRVTY